MEKGRVSDTSPAAYPTWGIRSKKELKDSPHRSCSLLSTHQTNDDMVLVRLFSS
jgi:hypothetical protein